MNKINWLNYWGKKNIWAESALWKKNTEIFYKKTSNILNYDENQKVLEIGSGNGDLAIKISTKVDTIYCLDTSQEFINICKNKISNKKNIKILKLKDDYTDLSFIRNIKFSIIIVNSVVQYYRSQREIIDLIKSVKKIATENAYMLISDIEIDSNKTTSRLKLIYNSLINGYFISLMKMGIKLIIDKEYSNTNKKQNILIINLDKLIQDISIIVKEVTIVNKVLTVNPDRKHLLIQF